MLSKQRSSISTYTANEGRQHLADTPRTDLPRTSNLLRQPCVSQLHPWRLCWPQSMPHSSESGTCEPVPNMA
jgi:hypothetical protein